MQPEKEIMFFEPVLKHNIWGGTRLREEFGYKEEGNDIGECWGIAAHENGDASVKNGIYQGKKLSVLWKEAPEVFGTDGSGKFPLLTKIIDAKADLSIQVHPDDAYAREHENGSLGKTECWYILDCPEDATLVVGHNASNVEELRDMVYGRKWDAFIREISVHKGDFVQMDPGTVHAIKGGILLLEIQQNSDITYRVYDYDRLVDGKPRQLHIEKSLDVIQVPAKQIADSVISTLPFAKNQWHLLSGGSYYEIYLARVQGCLKVEEDYPFLTCSVTEGEGTIDGIHIKKGDHFLIPNGYGVFTLEGDFELVAAAACL